MKKVLHILISFFSVIIAIIGLAFAIIEARLIFSGDWTIYQFQFSGYFRYSLRFLISLFSIFIAVFYFIKSKINSIKFNFIFNLCLLQLAICSIIILFLVSNYVNFAVFALTSIYILLNGANALINKNR